MSVDAVAWALRQATGSAATKCVLLVLADVANAEGESWYGQRLLAKRAEVSVRQLREHLKRLEDKGLIVRTARSRDDGSRTTDVYRLRLELRAPPAKIAGGGEADSRGPRKSTAGHDPLGDPEKASVEAQDLFGNGKPEEVPYSESFAQVWEVHHKGDKRKAFEHYRKAIKSRAVTHDQLLAALRTYVATFHGDFTGAALFRWIRDQRWEEIQAMNGSGSAKSFAEREAEQWSRLAGGAA